MAIAVVPGLLMTVVATCGDQTVEDFGKVALKTWLELDCAYGSRAAHIEHVRNPSINAGATNRGLDLRGNVVHMAVTVGRDRQIFLMGH